MNTDYISSINYKLLSTYVIEEFPLTKWEWNSDTEEIILKDNNCNALFFNSNIKKTLSLVEFIGLVKREDQLKVLYAFTSDNYNRESGLLIKFRIESPNYTFHLIECFAHLHREENKTSIRGFFRDITKFISKTNEAEELKDMIVERQKVLQVGYWERNTDTSDLLWSSELYEIYGLTDTSVKPSTLYFLNKIVHPDDAQKVKAKLQLFYQKKKPFNLNYRIIRTDGSLRKIQAKATIINNSKGEFLKYMGASVDITEV